MKDNGANIDAAVGTDALYKTMGKTVVSYRSTGSVKAGWKVHLGCADSTSTQ